MDYSKHYSTVQTPQSEPIPGTSQVPNSAGGFAWAVDDWVRLDRFLILGTEGGTYYIGERELTIENAEAVRRCIKADGKRTVARIVEISKEGRAPKNDAALFALAMCMSPQLTGGSTSAAVDTRKAAFEALPQVARIGTHLFTFLHYVDGFRGWGRGLREAVAKWYNLKEPERLTYQLIKYRQRGGWTHRDALRLAHPKPPSDKHGALYKWVAQQDVTDIVFDSDSLAFGFLEMQEAESAKQVLATLSNYPGLPWETIPSQFLKEPSVWDALLPKMPMTALIRNLGRMTANGLLKPLSDATHLAAKRLVDEERVRKARVHPIQVLAALLTYQAGHGARGKLTWEPVSPVVDALDAAFYLAFGNVEPTGKRLVIGLDVSGSMGYSEIAGIPGLTPRVASAALCMVNARVEERQPAIMAFSHEFVPFEVSPRQRLDDICHKADKLPFGATDCALPMLWAMERKVNADAFLIYTDHESWYGNIHPSQALQKYRQDSGIDAKLVVVGMVSNEFSIADPDDAGMLDVVGFDTATPNLISGFIRE